MDPQTVAKLTQLEQGKFHGQAIDYLKSIYAEHKTDEKWMEAALFKITDLLVQLRYLHHHVPA